MKIDTEIISKKHDWDNVIKNFEKSTIFHTTEWKKLIENLGGKGFLLAAKENDCITGILPIFITKSKILHLKQFFSIPFTDQDGLLLDSNPNDTLKALLKTLEKMINEHNPAKTTINTSHVLMLNARVTPILRYGIDISGLTEEQVWKGFTTNVRRYTSKSKKMGVELSMKTRPSFYKEYYKMYNDLATRRNLIIGRFSKQFFKTLFGILKNNMKVLAAEIDDKILSAMIILPYNNVLYAYLLASYNDAFKFYPNYLLYWEMIRWAIDNKFKLIDIGTAGVGKHTGLHSYKRKYNIFTETTYTWEINHSRKALFEGIIYDIGRGVMNLLYTNFEE